MAVSEILYGEMAGRHIFRSHHHATMFDILSTSSQLCHFRLFCDDPEMPRELMIYIGILVDKRIPRRRQGGQGILLGLVKWEWMAVFLLSGDGGHVPQEEETEQDGR